LLVFQVKYFYQSPALRLAAKALLPVKDALDVLSGKWKLQIILSLTFGKKHFNQIQRELPV